MPEVTIYLLCFLGIISLNFIIGRFTGFFSILVIITSLILIFTNIAKLWPLLVFIVILIFIMKYFPKSIFLKIFLGIWLLSAFILDWLHLVP